MRWAHPNIYTDIRTVICSGSVKVFFDEIRLPSRKEFETIAITDRVDEAIKKSGVQNGNVTLFSQHTTASIRISEDEKSLETDYENFFEKLAPKAGTYGHNETNVDDRKNAHSHLQSMLLNSGETIPIKDGKMMLGTWQTIFFVELDGPRPERRVIVQVMGE